MTSLKGVKFKSHTLSSKKKKNPPFQFVRVILAKGHTSLETNGSLRSSALNTVPCHQTTFIEICNQLQPLSNESASLQVVSFSMCETATKLLNFLPWGFLVPVGFLSSPHLSNNKMSLKSRLTSKSTINYNNYRYIRLQSLEDSPCLKGYFQGW